jgi:hypothetical protein
LDFAKKRAAVCRSQGHRARILTAEGQRVIVDWNEPLEFQQTSLTLHNSHEMETWRDRFHNKSTDTWYLKLSTSSNPLDPPDLSIAGPTPEAVFERFTTNPHWRQYHDRFVVEEIHTQPVTEPVSTEPAVAIEVPAGQQLVSASWRPGNGR